MTGGKADGFRAIDMLNDTGIHFTVFPDRAMDIGFFTYKGINIAYHAPAGLVGPQYFHSHKDGFARSWHGGFLTTCGLTFAGVSSEDSGDDLPLHGLVDNIPATSTFAGIEYEDGQPTMVAKGEMTQAVQGGENLLLKREIRCGVHEKTIRLSDSVTNLGFTDQPLMLIYHCNFGYPLLADGSYAVFCSKETYGWDEIAKRNIDTCRSFTNPTQDASEQVFYHTMIGDVEGNTQAAIINPNLSIGIVFKYCISQLKVMVQVKNMKNGSYLATIEPCNCGIEGRKRERELGRLETIEGGETKPFFLEIQVLDGAEEISEFEENVRQLCN